MKKLKEMKIPRISYFALIFGILFITWGASANFIVVQENQGRMPVWTSSSISNTDTHFAITDINKVKHLQYADIYPIGKGNVASLGDFLMTIGMFLFISSQILVVYNMIINYIVKRSRRKCR